MDGFLARIGCAVAAVLLLLLTARCGLVRSHPSDAEPGDTQTRSSAQQSPSDAAASAPQPGAAAPVPEAPAVPQPPATEPTAPPQPAVPEPGVSATAPQAALGQAPQPQPAAPVAPTPRGKPSVPPTAKRPAIPPRPAEPTGATPENAARKGAAAGAKAPAPAAPLDVNKLKQELKDTKAIGVFSKLTLKNQMNDLLSALRKFHKGQGKVTLADLHRSYELLVMKVLSLVQDDDKKLASDIVSSREAIWSILADPKRFTALQR
jgi:hypothetical protein